MYRRVLLTLYRGGRGRTAGVLTVSRNTDHILKCFSLGNVHCSENKPPEDQGSSNPATDGEKSPEVHASSKPPTDGEKSPEVHASSKPPTDGEKPHEDQEASKPPTVVKADVRHKQDSSQPPHKDTLMNIISGMKVEVSSQKRLLAMKRGKKEEQKWAGARDELESASKMFEMASKEKQPGEKAVSPEMAAAVSAVASTFPDKKNEVESELLQHLRMQMQMSKKQERGDVNIREVIAGMQIKQKSIPSAIRKTRQAAELEQDMKQTRSSSQNLSSGKRLNIFPAPLTSKERSKTVAESESSLTLWDIELAKEIAAACDQSPRNGFEEMIQWTNEGKLWTFPINNEAGLDEEQNVEFHEHIFLDRYLEDFPKQGPIRHFMELVVCGLSKNPFLTVQQKKEHIDWFRDYFNQKEEILKECDVYLN